MRWQCRMLEVQPSGYYAWIRQPVSGQHQANQQLSGVIKQSWLESGGVYGYRKIHSDLRDMGFACGINRVHRVMKIARIKAQVSYRAPRCRGAEVERVMLFHRTACSASSILLNQTKPGLPILRISVLMKDGCTWPSSWICSLVA